MTVCLMIILFTGFFITKSKGQCITGSVRLENGILNDATLTEGRVEVCYNGQWGTVCDDEFNDLDATVVCRQLGFTEDDLAVFLIDHRFGEGTGPIWLDDLVCEGIESSLLDCEGNLNNHDCTHDEDVGIRCVRAGCTDGSIRLVDNTFSSEGRIELCALNQWWELCNENFGINEGRVACRQLGFQDIIDINRDLCRGDGDVWPFAYAQCNGNENRVVACGIITYGSGYEPPCENTTTVGLMCYDPSRVDCVEGSVRLINGEDASEGRIEVCLLGHWGSVCDSSFEKNVEGRVICRQLGFADVLDVVSYGEGNSSITWLDIGCNNGNEMNILQCNSVRDTNTSRCGLAGSDVGLRCLQTLSTNANGLNPTTIGAAISSFVIVIIVTTLFFAVVIIAIKWKKLKYRINNQAQSVPAQSVELNIYDNTTLEDVESSKFLGLKEIGVESSIFSDSLIEPSNLEVVEKIGQGEFGIVYRALLTIQEQKEMTMIPVAVKTLKSNYSQSETCQLIEEASKMITFDHINVLSLTGICLGLFGSPCIVMPFMSNGSLLSYLRKESHNLSTSESTDENVILDTTKQLLSMCLQVANGMAYLTKQRFVHRDLAARNCMISSDGVIKVADFGLAEDIYTAEYFKQSHDSNEPVKLPIKWMALESIHYGKFNEKTDVWSFGIVCWEVFTLGRSPYPGLDPRSVIRLLDGGERLDKPSTPSCTQEIYSLMLSCWDESSAKRPLFLDIVNNIEKLIAPLADYMDFSAVYIMKT